MRAWTWPALGLFIAIYAIALGVLVFTGRPLEDVLGAAVILGGFLPLVGALACLRMPMPTPPGPWQRGEGWVLVGLLAWITLFLAGKGPLLDVLVPPAGDPRWRDTVNTLLKLAAFVGVPALMIRQGLGWPSVGHPTTSQTRRLVAVAIVAVAAYAVQALMGSQFHKLMGGDYAQRHWVAGFLACFAWMSVEAGLVEEFFFRFYLQSRLTAWTRSSLAGVLLGALIFGLAHAPGMILRGAGVQEGLGVAPPVLSTIAYAITVQGVAGLVFGLLWARTRSLVPLVLLHGFVDALSNTAAFMDTWRL